MENRDPVTRETIFTQKERVRNVQVPGNTITRNTYVQPTVQTINERIRIQQAPEIRRTLEPIVKPTQTQNNNRTRSVTVPAAKIYKQDVIQPILTQERVQLQFNNEQDQYINRGPETLPTKFSQKTTTKNVTVPGGKIYRQKIYQPIVTNQNLDVKVLDSEPVYRTAPAKVSRQHRHSTQRVDHQVYHTLPAYQNVPVPVPVRHDVPLYKDVPVYVEMPEDESEEVINWSEMNYGGY